MGSVLHGSATTTAAVRRAIQQSQESLTRLAERDDMNPKDGRKVEEAHACGRCAHGTEKAAATFSLLCRLPTAKQIGMHFLTSLLASASNMRPSTA